ncbi:TBC1 domain family member 31 [Homo sapiens]|uniref:TBC1 domain family member 31 n=2 Tax=Homo sapiens TaxID=9606 RepID=E5RI94_HUMAN|nr:TBC1 domain family member 31 [Homo sapiens]KAI4011846.1 TBC1 domain family member 31 [Homo sapiens]
MKVTSGRVQQPAKSRESKMQTRILKQDLTGDFESKKNELPDGLNKKRLQILLKGYGEYPTKYRMFIWRSLLQLPENHTAFSTLIDKGTHVAFLNLQKKYPIKSRKLLRVLQRTLSALAHWSVIFSDTPYLPLLAFPFVKLFQNNQLICFEVIATLIINWCQHWFEYFPNPPINILSMIENVLAFHDKELLQHFIDHDITSQLYAWPLLETVFSEVLTREEWLKLFDNIFSNHPSFLLMTVVAYNICSRTPLLSCNLKDDFETVEDMQAKVDQQRVEDEAWYQKQELLRKAEETRREMLLQEEEKMIQQRQRLAAVKRELKVKEMHLQDAARRRFLKLQQDQQEMELRRLDDEIGRKVYMRDREIAATARDLEMRQLELESQKRLYEKNLTENQEALAKEMRADADAYRRKVDLEEHMFHKLIEAGETQSQKTQKVIKENLAKAEQACLNTDWQIQSLHKQKCDDLQRNKCYQEVAKLLRENRRKEIEIINAMVEEEAKKWKEAEGKEFRLRSAKKASALSDASRKWFLKQEINAAVEHAENPCHKEEPRFQNEQDSSCLPRTSQLNDSSEMDPSTQISLNRRAVEWDTTGQNLIKKVRNLRQRLTARARHRCQTPHLLAA